MTNQEKEKLKKISIRGRFAYGLICLEKVIEKTRAECPELKSLVGKMWEVTNSEKLGWWQDLLVENNPKVVIGDYELFKTGRITFEEIGFATITSKAEFENRVKFLIKLPNPIPQILDKLKEIANQNLFAGCGEYSKLTYKSSIELIEIMDSMIDFKRPKLELIDFSDFKENNGWGNQFAREKIVTN